MLTHGIDPSAVPVTEPASVWIDGIEAPLLGGTGRARALELALNRLDVAEGTRWE
jgi:hypothetical protein